MRVALGGFLVLNSNNNVMGFRIEYIDGIKFELPAILYKYRDWSNPFHKKVLQDNSLYLASPKTFEDIHDCNVPQRFPIKSELYHFFLKKSKKDNPYKKRQEHRSFAKYWSVCSPLANPSQLKQNIEYINQEFNNNLGVLCLTTNCHNDDMWKKYSNEYKGVCIGFDTKLLFECIGGGGKVQYVDILPTIDFVKDDFRTKHFKNIFCKEKMWEFEQEYRLHKMWKKNATDNERNIKLPDECIVEILLGKSISQEDKDQVTKIATEKYPKAKIVEY